MSEHQELQVVVFSLINQQDKIEFGIPIEEVQEIIRLQKITLLPEYPHFVEGVLNLRGTVTPVIDLAKRFGFNAGIRTEQTGIIVCEVNGFRAGIVVDAVSEVLRLLDIEAPPSLTGNNASEYLQGVARVENRLILVINLEQIFSSLEMLAGEPLLV